MFDSKHSGMNLLFSLSCYANTRRSCSESFIGQFIKVYFIKIHIFQLMSLHQSYLWTKWATNICEREAVVHVISRVCQATVCMSLQCKAFSLFFFLSPHVKFKVKIWLNFSVILHNVPSFLPSFSPTKQTNEWQLIFIKTHRQKQCYGL